MADWVGGQVGRRVAYRLRFERRGGAGPVREDRAFNTREARGRDDHTSDLLTNMSEILFCDNWVSDDTVTREVGHAPRLLQASASWFSIVFSCSLVF
jgi:hypothetical protein